MSLIDRVMQDAELQADPPVLMDVGAAGGVPRSWRRIARYCIVVAFEPDAPRSPLTSDQSAFLRWIYVPAVVVSTGTTDRTAFYLTRSPQCSSTLEPLAEALRPWAFAGQFEIVGRRELPAATLSKVMADHGLSGIDWIKLDTQGTDWRLFRSLPDEIRRKVLVSEFEPGLIDAYAGEDTMADILAGMRSEPFWLAEFGIERTPRAAAAFSSSWFRRLAPSAPGWGNLRYLRSLDGGVHALDRRGHLLLWCLASLLDQPAHAQVVAAAGFARFGDGLFADMQAAAVRQLRGRMLRRFPGWLLRRLLQGR